VAGLVCFWNVEPVMFRRTSLSGGCMSPCLRVGSLWACCGRVDGHHSIPGKAPQLKDRRDNHTNVLVGPQPMNHNHKPRWSFPFINPSTPKASVCTPSREILQVLRGSDSSNTVLYGLSSAQPPSLFQSRIEILLYCTVINRNRDNHDLPNRDLHLVSADPLRANK